MEKVEIIQTYHAKFHKFIFLGIFLIFSLVLTVSCEKKPPEKSGKKIDQLSQYKYQQTKEIVQLVDCAAKLIEKEGRKAFPKFRKKGSKWYHGNTYIFVWGLDGMRYVYPRNPEGEGKNMLSLKDVQEKPIGKMITNAAKNKNGEGWVFYEWTKPGHDEPAWKATFIKKAVAPSGKKYLVGCGEYNMKMEKEFIVQTVNEAASFLKKHRKTAFQTFNSPASKFIYLDTYVFVKDIHGNELVNPGSPELVGKNIYDLQDAHGKYMIRDEIEALKNKDSCWIEYYWHKPNEKEPSQKLVFVKKVVVDGDTLVVGSGFYPKQ